MDKRLPRLVLSTLSSWPTGKFSLRILRRSPDEGSMPSRLFSQAQSGHSKVSFARRHGRHQAGASNLVLPSPRHRLAVQRQNQTSVDQFGQFPYSPKRVRPIRLYARRTESPTTIDFNSQPRAFRLTQEGALASSNNPKTSPHTYHHQE